MNLNKKYITLIGISIISSNIYASEATQALKTNGQIIHTQKAKSVDNISDMLLDGQVYGRLRLNSFYADYEIDSPSHSDHATMGLGGSLVYKSANLSGLSFGVGLYYTYAEWWDDNDNISNLKKGKDVLSRFDYENTNDSYMAIVGQAYVDYNVIEDTHIIVGRQLIESFYTKSNDTKMIPNAFDGIVVTSDNIDNTHIKLAYLYKQKLRDHTQSHSVLMYADSNTSSSSHPNWNSNDDSAMHKGLTYTALKAHGKPTDSPLLTGDIKYKYNNIKLDGSFYIVPELLSQIMIETNYKVNFDSFNLSYGMRYIKQFDHGAGAVGGASYTGDSTGYTNPSSLDAQMIALRVVAKVDNYKINLAYSNVLDEADLITPWRGFPTAGYTRSMARYNWRANTQSYRLELVRNANSKGIYKDIFTQTSILYTDADENKGGKDEIYYYQGFVQNIPSIPNMQWRLRLGYRQFTDNSSGDLDARVEVNYMF